MGRGKQFNIFSLDRESHAAAIGWLADQTSGQLAGQLATTSRQRVYFIR